MNEMDQKETKKMNENGLKSPKMNGIIKIEINQLSKMKQLNQNES